MKRVRDLMVTHNLDAAWKCVVETAALRRDSQTFHTVTIVVPVIGRSAMSSSADHRYWVRFFDEVYFRLDSKFVVRGRAIGDKYVVHADDEPAIVFDNGVMIWGRHGRIRRDGGPAIEHVRTTRGASVEKPIESMVLLPSHKTGLHNGTFMESFTASAVR